MDHCNIYKICIEDRTYSEWTIYIDGSYEEIELSTVNPVTEKLFNNDVFTYIDGKVNIIHSMLRNDKNIPGVLIFTGKTYGRNGKKMLYKLIPDDKRMPMFLTAKEPGINKFNKFNVDQYVLFTLKHWNNEHPEAVISNSLGSIDILDNFYEYQLYCKSLNVSIQNFSRNTASALRLKSEEEYIDSIMIKFPEIENRLNTNIYSIDPSMSKDFDDAFSITNINNNELVLSVYISNVSLWLDALNLWDSFSERVSTIYLPDRKRPMLPTCLSDCLCSLIQNNKRFALTCDFKIYNNKIVDVTYCNSLVKLSKNFVYEEKSLKLYTNYILLFNTVKLLSNSYKFNTSINDSHDVVHYIMVMMNYYSALEMMKSENGIYRSSISKREIVLPTNLSEDIIKFMNIWNSSGGQYVQYDKDLKHNLLKLDSYIHITSPIRRLPDLLNIIKIQQNKSLLSLSNKANEFYSKWEKRLDYINITMRAIRKVQVDCTLLKFVMMNTNVLDKLFKATVFDFIDRGDGLFQYMCYIPDIKLVSRMTLREHIEEYSHITVRLYIMIDEHNIKKKIRIEKI